MKARFARLSALMSATVSLILVGTTGVSAYAVTKTTEPGTCCGEVGVAENDTSAPQDTGSGSQDMAADPTVQAITDDPTVQEDEENPAPPARTKGGTQSRAFGDTPKGREATSETAGFMKMLAGIT